MTNEATADHCAAEGARNKVLTMKTTERRWGERAFSIFPLNQVK